MASGYENYLYESGIISRPELLANITLSGGNMKVKRIFFLLLMFGLGQLKTKKILYFFFLSLSFLVSRRESITS